MALGVDPSSAVFGLWQPGDHTGAEVFNVPGAITWNELQVRGLEAVLPFYEQVFGWRWTEAFPGYRVCNIDAKDSEDKSNGGAMEMPPGVPAEAPSTWMVYFAVADCETSTAQAVELGGSVFLPPMQMGPGVFSGITDPSGAMFFLGHFPQSATTG